MTRQPRVKTMRRMEENVDVEQHGSIAPAVRKGSLSTMQGAWG